jgi:kynurenine formamidase
LSKTFAHQLKPVNRPVRSATMSNPVNDWPDWLARTSAIDLAQVSHQDMPGSPNHPPFRLHPVRRHGDVIRADGASAANEILIMGSHTGTHIDALGHVSAAGRAYSGIDAAQLSGHRGLSALDAIELGTFLKPALLIDLPRLFGVPRLAPGQAIDRSVIVKWLDSTVSVAVDPGDAVIVRTGWGQLWDDPPAYMGDPSGVPGIDASAAQALTELGVSLIGSDTATVEVRAAGGFQDPLPVHTHCLVEAGVPLIENMNVERLSRVSPIKFLLVVLPLPIRGASGSPVRPVALIYD